MADNQRISRKHILCKLEGVQPDVNSIKMFIEKTQANEILLNNQGYFYMSRYGTRFNFKYGVYSIAKQLNLPDDSITVVTKYKTLPEEFIIDTMKGEFDESEWVFRHGKYADNEAMETLADVLVDNIKNKKRTEIIKNHNIQQLEVMGMINEHNRAKVVAMKEAQETEETEDDCKPDLDGEFTWKFEHYEADPNRGQDRPSGKYPPKEVTVFGIPGVINRKKKGWWMQSSVSGMGKTYFLRVFAEKFNAQIMLSGTNVTCLRKNVQFILFDETANLPDFEKFKTMTSGCCGTSFNRKMAGADFKPREDVQFIICANISPFEFYGKFDNKLQRRMMSADAYSQLEQRLYYVKLDGDGDEERRKFMDPETWSVKDLRVEIKKCELPHTKDGFTTSNDVDQEIFVKDTVPLIKRWWRRADMNIVKELIPERFHACADRMYTNQLHRKYSKDVTAVKSDMNGIRAVMHNGGACKRLIDEVICYMDPSKKRVKKHPSQATDVDELSAMLVQKSVDERDIIKYAYDMMKDEDKAFFDTNMKLVKARNFKRVMYIMAELIFRHDTSMGMIQHFESEIGSYLYEDLTGKPYDGYLDEFLGESDDDDAV